MKPASRSSEQYVVKTVGALPVLRRFLTDMGVAEVIDGILPKDPQAFLSVGQVTEALVANRLCSPRPLYRVQEWAQRAGIEQVFGFRAEWLNDDRLGRVLDRLADSAKILKSEICLSLVKRYGIELKRLHFDLTTVWLHGEYEEEEAGHIRIEYTKDNKWDPAGKGFRVGVSTFDDGRGAVSFDYQALDGTESTHSAAVKNMKALRKALGPHIDRVLQVSDRAGVKSEVVATAAREKFDVLGPLAMNKTLKDKVRALLAGSPPWQRMSYVSGRQTHKPEDEQERYRAFEVPYEFRWEDEKYPARLIVVSSDGKRKRDEKSRGKHQARIEKHLEELTLKLGQPRDPRGKKLNVRRRVEEIVEAYPEGKFYEITWEGSSELPTGFSWRTLPDLVDLAKTLEGIYAVATTLPPSQPLDEVFTQLKQQWRVEDSHRILKGPLRISPVFLHQPKRIEGLIFLLWVALVVYQLLERQWRQKAQDAKMKRWTTQVLLRVFEGYSYVGVQQAEQVRWVPCVVPSLHQLVYATMGLGASDNAPGRGP